MPKKHYSNVIGIDDGPFEKEHRGDVAAIGTIYAGERFDGLLIGKVRRDGRNSTDALAAMIEDSRHDHIQLVMIHGIALGGFNVVDIQSLSQRLDRPVLVVARRKPDLAAIKKALYTRVPGGKRKWRLIEEAGPMEPLEDLYVQRVGIETEAAAAVLRRFAIHGKLPEPLRMAHLIAGAVVRGESHGGA